jgi:hypothetical protein
MTPTGNGETIMRAFFTTNTRDVLSAFQLIGSGTAEDARIESSCLLFELVSDNNSRAAILPPTVGWFALTWESEKVTGVKLQVMGTNADGYLVFTILHGETSSQLCVLNRGDSVRLHLEHNSSVATMNYHANAVDLSMEVAGGQHFFKNIITFTGQTPKSKIGKGESVARPLDDTGFNRVYLDHSLVDALGVRSAVSFARTDHTSKITYNKHAHIDDNIRIICSGKFRFSIFDPETDTLVYECEVISGDSIQIPAGYAYVEEVIEPGVQINSRSTYRLHYLVDPPVNLRSAAECEVTLSLGLFENQ